MEEILDNIIKLTDESGAETEFEFLDLIEYEGGEYVVLLPVEDEGDEVVILKVQSLNDDEEEYISIEDDATLQAIFEIFKQKFKDMFDFAD